MNFRAIIIAFVVVSSVASVSASAPPRPKADTFPEFVRGIAGRIPADPSGPFVIPSDNELREWTAILQLFQSQRFDSCRALLRKYGYSLTQSKDARTGATYDVIREDLPVRRGWGTFIHNRNGSRRLIVQVNHPVEDGEALDLGAALFRRSGAEWLLVAGGAKTAQGGRADAGTARRSVFQRIHESLCDLTHVSVSLHSFDERKYAAPIRSTDIVVSNGKTTDEQWGISQMSLSFRDTLRESGFAASLAMYDSGYARLAGGWNVQGVFANDSLGFGHWIYLELSHRLRTHGAQYGQLVAALDRALTITGRKVSQQVNRAFGLVSPRVVRVDSLHRIFFPPTGSETYRIVSFNARSSRNDTIDLRLGNWLQMLGSEKTIAAVSPLDSGEGAHAARRDAGRRATMARILPIPEVAVQHARDEVPDSVMGTDDEGRTMEPLQVHRIPLQPVFASTVSQGSIAAAVPVSFRWEGTISANFRPSIPLFQMSTPEDLQEAAHSVPRFLIPLLHSSYGSSTNKFVGIQMTQVLVTEIARLVTENKASDKDIGLLAEQSEKGDYYLRLFADTKRPATASR